MKIKIKKILFLFSVGLLLITLFMLISLGNIQSLDLDSRQAKFHQCSQWLEDDGYFRQICDSPIGNFLLFSSFLGILISFDSILPEEEEKE